MRTQPLNNINPICTKAQTDTGLHYVAFGQLPDCNFEIVSFFNDGKYQIKRYGLKIMSKMAAFDFEKKLIPFEEYDNARHRAKMLMLDGVPF